MTATSTGTDPTVRLLASSRAHATRIVDTLDAVDRQLGVVASTLGQRPAPLDAGDGDPVTELHLRKLAAEATATMVTRVVPRSLAEFLA